MKNILIASLYVLLSWWLNPPGAYAQPIFTNKKTIDSLEHILPTLPADSNRVNALCLLANTFMVRDPDRSRMMAQEGLELSNQLEYVAGQVKCSQSLAFIYNITGEWAKGIALVYEGLDRAKKYSPDYEIGSYNILTLAFIKQGDFRRALTWVLISIRQSEISRSSIYANWPTYMQAGGIYSELHQTDSALKYARLSVNIARAILGNTEVAYSLATMGQVFRQSSQFDSAEIYMRKARAIFEETGNDFSVQEMNRDLAMSFLSSNRLDSAEIYAQMAYDGASRIKNPLVVRDAADILAQLHELKNLPSAFRYLKISRQIKDSLMAIDRINQMQQTEFNERQKVSDLEKAKLAEKNKFRQNSLIGITGSIAVIALILGVNNRHRKKANKTLGLQKEEIQNALSQLRSTQAQLVHSEKMASLGELTAGIAHEIQNPLNFVNNFSEVNKELLEELQLSIERGEYGDAKKLAFDLVKNQDKITEHGRRADSIVKSMLQHSHSATGQRELTDINALCDECVRLSYHGFRARDKDFNVELKTDFSYSLTKISVVPQEIGRVLLNLLNNAFYAVNERRKQLGEKYQPLVEVTTKRKGKNVEILVKDNANGIPEKIREKIFQPFFTTKPAGLGTGLGLSLSYDIIKAHGGEVKLDTFDGSGSVFSIQLPET